MFMVSYSPLYDHGGSDPTLLTRVFLRSSFCRQANQVEHLFLPFHLSQRGVRLVLSISGLCKDARASGAPADLIRCYGSRRVLLVVHGVLFRDGSLSISCRRVLCFCSIHFALSHFVSVNSASSGCSPTSPSPLYASVRPPVSSHSA
jgi:hypothetical protein